MLTTTETDQDISLLSLVNSAFSNKNTDHNSAYDEEEKENKKENDRVASPTKFIAILFNYIATRKAKTILHSERPKLYTVKNP